MNNALLIHFDDNPLVTVLVPVDSLKTITEILDFYSRVVDIDRNRLHGEWTKVIDLTKSFSGQFVLPEPVHPDSFLK